MQLTRVEYHLFESDAQSLDQNPDCHFHEIDREICLVDSSGVRTYVSWQQIEDWAEVGLSAESFFVPPIPVVRDVSNSPLWRDIVGNEVTLSRSGYLNDTLTIACANESVFCCCYETGHGWGADVIHVTKTALTRPFANSPAEQLSQRKVRGQFRLTPSAPPRNRLCADRAKLRPTRKI